MKEDVGANTPVADVLIMGINTCVVATGQSPRYGVEPHKNAYPVRDMQKATKNRHVHNARDGLRISAIYARILAPVSCSTPRMILARSLVISSSARVRSLLRKVSR